MRPKHKQRLRSLALGMKPGKLGRASRMARQLFQQTRLSKELSVFASHRDVAAHEDASYRAMTPLQRWEAVELMRQMNWPDYDPHTDRLPRFYTVVEPASR